MRIADGQFLFDERPIQFLCGEMHYFRIPKELWRDRLRKAMESHPGIHTLVVDLKDVGFIDSRAVGGLIRIWKEMAANGGRMFYA